MALLSAAALLVYVFVFVVMLYYGALAYPERAPLDTRLVALGGLGAWFGPSLFAFEGMGTAIAIFESMGGRDLYAYERVLRAACAAHPLVGRSAPLATAAALDHPKAQAAPYAPGSAVRAAWTLAAASGAHCRRPRRRAFEVLVARHQIRRQPAALPRRGLRRLPGVGRRGGLDPGLNPAPELALISPELALTPPPSHPAYSPLPSAEEVHKLASATPSFARPSPPRWPR